MRKSKRYNRLYLLIIVFILHSLNAANAQTDSLKKILEDFQVNQFGGVSKQKRPVLIIPPDSSGYKIIWIDRRNGEDDIYSQRYDLSGNKIGKNQFVCSLPENAKIFLDDLGDFIIAYFIGNKIIIRTYDYFFNNERTISMDIDGFYLIYPDDFTISRNEAGQYLVVWRASLRDGSYTKPYGRILSETGEILTQPYFRALGITISGNFKNIKSTTVGDSAFVIMAQKDTLLYYQIYRDGLLFTHGEKVSEFGFAKMDYTISGSDSSFFVAWQEDQEASQIYGQWFDSNGEKHGTTFKINKNQDDWVFENNTAIYSKYSAFFAWVAKQKVPNYDYNIFVQNIQDTTLIWAEDLKLNDELSEFTYSVSNVVINDNIVAVWDKSQLIDNDPYIYDNNVYKRIVNFQGGFITPIEKVNDDTLSRGRSGSQILLKDGNFFVFIKDWLSLFGKEYAFTGEELSEINIPLLDSLDVGRYKINSNLTNNLITINSFSGMGNIICDENFQQSSDFIQTHYNGWAIYMDADMNDNGEFINVWDDFIISFQIFDAEGNRVGESKTIYPGNDDIHAKPVCALNNSGFFYIVRQLKDYPYINLKPKIALHKFNPGLTQEGDYLIISDDEADSVSHFDPQMDMNHSTGNFVVTWQDNRNGDYDIYAQMFDSEGMPIGSNIKVNDDLSGAKQETPKVSMDENDNFVITWSDYRNGHSDVYAQIFLSNGTLWGNNFLVNKDTLRNQKIEDIDFKDNKILFSWITNHIEGRGYNVWVNMFEWSGTVGVNDKNQLNPTKFNITEGYPNPFNMEINFKYTVPTNVTGNIEISVYNVLGEKVKTLVKKEAVSGEYSIKWDGRNSKGNVMPSGIYLVKFSSGEKSLVRKVMLLK